MRCGDIDCGKLTRAESRCDAWQQASLISLRRWGPLVPNTADIVGVTVRPALGLAVCPESHAQRTSPLSQLLYPKLQQRSVWVALAAKSVTYWNYCDHVRHRANSP